MIIEKYTTPTSFDSAEYGTRWRVLGHDEQDCQIYIQVSKEINNPKWCKIGSFLEKSFEDYMLHEKFIESCLLLFNKKEHSIEKIIHLLDKI